MVVVLMAATPALAFQAQQGFVPADTLHQESVPGGTLVIIAYAVAWLAVVAYVLTLSRKAGRLERDLTDLATKVGASRR
jgi:CcmD family protein